MKKITILLAAIAVVSCKERNESSAQYGEPQEIETKAYSELQKANWLVGEWRNWNKEGNLTEIWSSKNDSTLSGATHFTVEIDTMFSEKIEITQVKDSLFYNTKVSNQNDGKMVSFKATSITEDELVFENPKHDFPQKITYRKITSDSLVAEISGMKNGKESKESFPMKKK
ncbi:DUF6265 family protein [Flavobacterium sp.]|uniref:DUF6265 family protein n=1 Tax=Flavobacterium sp. TaxID=239 RepID=UPI0028BE9C9E|nr:DUF6265 family protein [Flavobacterium sp.]